MRVLGSGLVIIRHTATFWWNQRTRSLWFICVYLGMQTLWLNWRQSYATDLQYDKFSFLQHHKQIIKYVWKDKSVSFSTYWERRTDVELVLGFLWVLCCSIEHDTPGVGVPRVPLRVLTTGIHLFIWLSEMIPSLASFLPQKPKFLF